jgi:hypothetical protein
MGCDRDERVATDERGLTLPTQMCREAEPSQSCRTADDIEALLQDDTLEIVAASATGSGVQRARVLTLRRGGKRPIVFRAKWRARSTTTRRNIPRYELAAYAVQKLFLSPREYVVPPTATHCFPIEQYRARVDPAAKPTFPDQQCVHGVLSYWLEDVVTVADANAAGWFHGQHRHAFDPALWQRDRAYRDSLARVNLLTYLIGHRDSHARNFVIARSGKPAHHVVYSIDNSLAFTLAKNPNIAPRHDWSTIRVPALPRETVHRLHASYGRLDSLAAAGLAPWELEGVRVRAAALLARIERGDLQLY